MPRHRFSVRAKGSPSLDVRWYCFCFVKKSVFYFLHNLARGESLDNESDADLMSPSYRPLFPTFYSM